MMTERVKDANYEYACKVRLGRVKVELSVCRVQM